MKHSTYLTDAIQPDKRAKSIATLVKNIKASGISFDAIVFRGLSGALIAPSVADILKMPIIAVRKGENSHSYYDVESAVFECESYIMIDDTIDTGATMDSIVEAMNKAFSNTPQLKAVFLYDSKSQWSLQGVPVLGTESTFPVVNENQ